MLSISQYYGFQLVYFTASMVCTIITQFIEHQIPSGLTALKDLGLLEDSLGSLWLTIRILLPLF